MAAASAKHAAMNMVVHAYDLFFYLGSWPTVSYLWTEQPRYFVGAACALGAMVRPWFKQRHMSHYQGRAGGVRRHSAGSCHGSWVVDAERISLYLSHPPVRGWQSVV